MRKVTGTLYERTSGGKNVPKVGADGKPITFVKLVVTGGQFHQDTEESDEDYCQRMNELLGEIDTFYAYWNGRFEDDTKERIDGLEGMFNYTADLVARAEAEPDKVSVVLANRIHAGSYFMDTDLQLYKKMNAQGPKVLAKWLDSEIKRLGTTIPGVVV